MYFQNGLIFLFTYITLNVYQISSKSQRVRYNFTKDCVDLIQKTQHREPHALRAGSTCTPAKTKLMLSVCIFMLGVSVRHNYLICVFDIQRKLLLWTNIHTERSYKSMPHVFIISATVIKRNYAHEPFSAQGYVTRYLIKESRSHRPVRQVFESES